LRGTRIFGKWVSWVKLTSRIGRRFGFATAAATASLVLISGAPAARADTTENVIGAVGLAFEAYKMFGSGELTLSQATTRIINAINAAKTEILHEIDQMAAVSVKACTKAAVIDLPDIRGMSRVTVEAFARDTTLCVATAEALISDMVDKPVIDQVGFLLDTVGPIALFARTYAHFGVSLLKTSLINGNESIKVRLKPSCRAMPLWGDAEPGAPVQVNLSCTAFNGHVGRDTVWARIRRGDPLPEFDYTDAIYLAMKGTSYQIAITVLPGLRA